MHHAGMLKLFFIKRRAKRIPQHKSIINAFSGKKGVEIGGPSPIFSADGLIPIYNYVYSLDGCNFSKNTLWEQKESNDNEYNYSKKKKGKLFIAEATNLESTENDHYDFVISSHCLEHIANPIKALFEWIRILKSKGHILLIVKKKKFF